MTEIPTLIALRVVTLFIFMNCLAWGAVWIRRVPDEWVYALPLMIVFTHATVYYSTYLLDWFDIFVEKPFDLQLYADWGSLFVLHVGFTSLIIVIDLSTNFFTKIIERHFPGLIAHVE